MRGLILLAAMYLAYAWHSQTWPFEAAVYNYNVYFTYENEPELNLGVVNGLEACREMVNAHVSRKAQSISGNKMGRWSHTCCRIQGGTSCSVRER